MTECAILCVPKSASDCYRYKGAPAYHIGLMAQDVERITPHAVIEINGYKAVDYRAATEASRRIDSAA